MNDLSHDAKRLFATARQEFSPDAPDQARIERALAVRLGLTTVAVAGAVTSTTSASAAPGAAAGVAKAGPASLAILLKWLGLGAAVGVGLATGYGALTQGSPPTKTAPTHAVSAASSALTQSRSSSAEPSQPATKEPAPVGASAAHAAAPAKLMPKLAAPSLREALSAAAPPAPSLNATVAREAALLGEAARALRGGNASRALVLLNEHAQAFPKSVLAEERSAELVSTLCRLGRVDEARAEARRFSRLAPGSPLADSVESSCVQGR